MLEKIDPNIQRLITPIMTRMTSIYITERQRPVIGNQQHSDQYKREKQECVHIIFDGNRPECMLKKVNDETLKCAACGREVCIKFDGSNVQTLLDARKVIEQLMFFGMVNNMNPEIIMACIDMKKMLPDLAQITAELNDYVQREETNIDNVSNIGAEYQYRQITGGF